MKITFDNTAVDDSLTDFPMLIVFSSTQSDFWDHAKNDGSDIRFIDDDDSTELYFELELWNSTTRDMVAWVRISQVDANSASDHVWIYYGNDGASFNGYYSSNHVWDSDYRAVWHLNQTNGSYDDSTSNNNHGTEVSVESREAIAKIGKQCPEFDGELALDRDYIRVPHASSLDFSGDLFVEYWINTDDYNAEQSIIAKNRYSPGAGWNSELYPEKELMLQFGEGVSPYMASDSDPIDNNNVWYHCVISYNSTANSLQVYVNGNSQAMTGSYPTHWIPQPEPTYIGIANPNDASNWRYPFDGEIDEIRLSDTLRSSEWIEACYQYQVDQSKLTYESEETSIPAMISVNPSLVEKTYDDVGTRFTLNVTIANVTDLQGFDFNLTWDNSLITLAEVDFNTTLDDIWGSDNWFIAFNESGSGYYELAAASLSSSFNTIEPTPLTILEFRVEDAASGETAISFTMVKLSNSEWQPIRVEATEGLYRFTRPPTRLYVDPPLVEKIPDDVCTFFAINATVSDVSDLFGFDFNLTWDNTLVTLVSVDYNDTLNALWGEDNWLMIRNETASGWYKLVALSTESGFNGTATLAKLTFHVESFRNWEAESEFHFAVSKLSDSGAELISVDVSDGTYRMGGEKPTLQIEPSDVTCRKYCELFNVSITVNNAINVVDFTFEIQYNTTLLDYVDGSDVWGALGAGTLTFNESEGTFNGSVQSTTSITGNQWLVNITFHAAIHRIWKDENQIPDWVNDQSGRTFFIWANLSYQDHPDLYYQEGGLQEVNVTELSCTFSPIKGDVDNSGNVNIFDLRTVAYHYEINSGDPEWNVASKYDLNGDDIIDVLDLVLISSSFGFEYDG